MRSSGRLQRYLAVGAAVVALSGMVAACGSGSSSNSKQVTIGWIPWDEDIAATHLWKKALEDKGYKVKLVQTDVGPLFSGMAKGGASDPNFFLDAWLPNTHGDYWKQYKSNLTDVTQWYHKVYEQLAVPKFVKNVNSIGDLKGKQSQFGNQIVGIEPGAGEMRIVKNSVMPKYGLKGKYTLKESSTPAMLATLQRDIQAKKPVVVTLWKPHWAYTKYPIKPLKDPKLAFGSKENLHVLANKKWASDNKKVVGWLKNFSMTDEQLGSLETDIQNAGKNGEEKGVAKWLKANPGFEKKMTS